MTVQDRLASDTHAKTETALRTVTQLSAQLREIYGQYQALGGQPALAGYPWPEGYTEADFVDSMSAVAQIINYIETSGHYAPLIKLRLAF
jgi:hypothetical protein